jgi:predicted TIM-barrel fold metal-dependent hydrolase
VYADRLLTPWLDDLRGRVPGLALVDAHVHVGLGDPAGLLATMEDARDALDRAGAGAWLIPLGERGGYAERNLELARAARESGGRLHALARLDPADEPVARAEAALDAGAMGLKLHPRGEGFTLDDPRLDEVFALADARRLPVLVHCGTGVDGLGRTALARAIAAPGARIVLAHAAISDLAWLHRRLDEAPNVLFDTAWWNPADILALMALVPPGRILFGSDIPFASPVQHAITTLRCALQTGLPATALRAIMGGTAQLVAQHAPALPDLGPAPGPGPAVGPLLERLAVTLLTVAEPMLRQADPGEGLELARDACHVAAHTQDGEIFATVSRLMDVARHAETDPRRAARTPGFDCILVAAAVARTPRAGAPAWEAVAASAGRPSAAAA